MKKTSLAIKNLSKIFHENLALDDATLDFREGQVHALLGENGAGKSTLCKIISGALAPTRGTITIGEREYGRLTPQSAKESGVGMIYQEFNLVPRLSVYENLFLGKEIRKGLNINRKEMIRRSDEVFASLKIKLDSRTLIADLSVAYCQMVEIAKALLENVKILIMDEPTAPLTDQEINTLFEQIRRIKEQGVAIIYISHRIEELFEIADCVTVMRDGKIIKTLDAASTDKNELIRLMVGRPLGETFPLKKEAPNEGEPLLHIRGLTTNKIKNISFDLKRGEILGIVGLVGSGRSEVVRALFGADKIIGGEIEIMDGPARISSPSEAIQKGIILVPEDRKRQGLQLTMSIKENISLVKLKGISKATVVNKKKENALAVAAVEELKIKMASLKLRPGSLSGGNQQKVVLSRCLTTAAEVICLDEPTRGVDVGAKQEIYNIMNDFRAQGKGIILISSELRELLGMSDRLLVLHEGEISAEFERGATQEMILHAAISGEEMKITEVANEKGPVKTVL